MGDEHQVPVPAEPPRDFHFKYTVLKGLFLQSEDSTDDKTFDFVQHPSPFAICTYHLTFPSEVKQLWPHQSILPNRPTWR
jgi:hypothetical protein